jgi:Xaa-Pro dipeptidase
MSEYEIAGALAQSVESKGVQAVVSLITTDERISSYHHPLSTGKKFQNQPCSSYADANGA